MQEVRTLLYNYISINYWIWEDADPRPGSAAGSVSSLLMHHPSIHERCVAPFIVRDLCCPERSYRSLQRVLMSMTKSSMHLYSMLWTLRWTLKSPSTVMPTWWDRQSSSCRWARNPSHLKVCVALYLKSSHCRPQALRKLKFSSTKCTGNTYLEVFKMQCQICLTSTLSLLLGHCSHHQGSSSVHFVRVVSTKSRSATKVLCMGSALTAVDEVCDEGRTHLLCLTNLRISQLLCLTSSLLPLLWTLSCLKCRGQLSKKVSILCQIHYFWLAFNTKMQCSRYEYMLFYAFHAMHLCIPYTYFVYTMHK